MSASPGVSQDAGNEQEQNWKEVGKSKFSNPKRCFVYSTGHNEFMTTATALDQIFNSVGDCLSVEAAAKLRDLRISDELQSQLDTWATQNAMLNMSLPSSMAVPMNWTTSVYLVTGATCSRDPIFHRR